ncbi:GNAT family N-acetyltransferase [Massilia sp. P8910]|uniref:GNAT family N-acetyltransferase n=1 Tax=Massilia antarctica TaxID=2765360 RepID=UPI0006BB5F81|nr:MULTISPECIES: GNAT family protein [Massilia]MCE3604802.1 GNAT family N-acetyltransferase [Massilia antarctica]MCY0914633.1 GNAT family protein [Massilia sp. H27-R4]CUI08341.1 acetyltransferase, GNAT family [Janthinobacterium sp. CG23_2]CUU32127.1 acetyltransferase, GNAT family [Janthinobacterium sp. CG23_2]
MSATAGKARSVLSMMSLIRTARLLLEPLDSACARALRDRIADDDERTAWMQLCRTLAERPDLTSAWIVYCDGRALGTVALMLVDDTIGEIGFLVVRPERGRGYAREAVAAVTRHAFTAIGLHRLAGVTQSDNPAAAAVLERCGFRREGLMRGSHADGAVHRDCWLYARLATDQELVLVKSS